MDLYRSNTLDRTIGTTPNTRSYSWTIPTDVTKSSDYTIRLFDTSNPVNTTVTSGIFTLKSKGGGGGGGKKWLFIGGGALAAGAVVAVLAGGNGNGATDLPRPPLAPDGTSAFQLGGLIAIIIGKR